MVRAPKKPRTAWQYFQADRSVRSQLTAEAQQSGDFCYITRELGKLWRSMDTSAREPYERLAQQARHTHTSYETFLLEQAPLVQQDHPEWEYSQILSYLEQQWKLHPETSTTPTTTNTKTPATVTQTPATVTQNPATVTQIPAPITKIPVATPTTVDLTTLQQENQALRQQQQHLSETIQRLQQQVDSISTPSPSYLVSCGLMYLYWMSTQSSWPGTTVTREQREALTTV